MENRIRELRKRRGLTLKELAGLVDTSSQQISLLEKGKRRLTVEWMQRIAHALDCHPLELLDRGVHLKNERESALIELFRGLSEEQQEAFLKAVAALAKPLGDQSEVTSDTKSRPNIREAV